MTLPARYAIDTNLVLRPALRRMLCGAAEWSGAELYIPRTARWMAQRRHIVIAGRLAAQATRWEARQAGVQHERETEKLWIRRRAEALHSIFHTWIEAEPQRNDKAWSEAPETPETLAVVQALAADGVMRDGGLREIEEDAYCLAEGLSCGCRWIGSENLGLIAQERFGMWLEEEQRGGRYPEAERPFIVTPDQALATLLDGTAEQPRPWAMASLVYELTRPNDAALEASRVHWREMRRMATLAGEGGAPRAGAAVHAALDRAEEAKDVAGRSVMLARARGQVPRTRAAEERKVRQERSLRPFAGELPRDHGGGRREP